MQVIALPVALQRYVDAPPVAVRQRDIALALAKESRAKIVVLSCEADLGLVPQAETVAQKLAAFSAPLIEAGIDVDVVVLQGRPGDAIPPAVLERGADLAVVGTHSKRRFLDVNLGNTAS